jgi:hypothetical protein
MNGWKELWNDFEILGSFGNRLKYLSLSSFCEFMSETLSVSQAVVVSLSSSSFLKRLYDMPKPPGIPSSL